jgi:CBS domain-containing protein
MSATPTNTPAHGSYLMPALAHATVSDAMHPGVLSCDPDTTTTEIARMMAAHHVHCIVTMGISHEHGDHLVWGLITDRDVLKAGLAREEKTASTLAVQPMITVEPSMPLRAAAELMVEQRISHLVVVDPRLQRPAGVLSTLDIAGTLAWGEA